jgi:hypothetical protein
MASNNGATVPQDPTQGAQGATDLKGKGKAVATEEPVDQSMDEDDDEDSGDEEVSSIYLRMRLCVYCGAHS